MLWAEADEAKRAKPRAATIDLFIGSLVRVASTVSGLVVLSEAKDLIAVRHGHEILRYAQDDKATTRP